MRNLVVCCDGTWNTPDQESEGKLAPTNVVRIYNAIAGKNDQSVEQLKYYHPGVGTEGNWWDKLTGGAFGKGLDKNVMSGYKWLASEFEPGDHIYMFGFSRGAYTVRSLAGMIAHCDLLDLGGLTPQETWAAVEKAYQAYRERKKASDWKPQFAFHDKTSIHFLGVWDTVGALGIPNNLAILNLLDDDEKYRFHDTRIGGHITNARHAVAIDEKRASFTPTLWSNIDGNSKVKQIWFPGVHSDVGGGYAETGLSNGALKWMMDEAAGCGLGFSKDMVKQVIPNHHDELHDSYQGLFKHMRSNPRNAPALVAANSSAFHKSALDRHKDPPIIQAPYWPTKRLRVGESVTISVYADQPWNYTGLYVEKGQKYTFMASGEWLDRNISCGPGGADDGDFQPGEIAHLAGTVMDALEGAWKRITGNNEADLKGSRREPEYDWFRLLGAVAGDPSPAKRKKGLTKEVFDIGEGKKNKATATSGYLYCFANDAWGFYGNNKGSVHLKIIREA